MILRDNEDTNDDNEDMKQFDPSDVDDHIFIHCSTRDVQTCQSDSDRQVRP